MRALWFVLYSTYFRLDKTSANNALQLGWEMGMAQSGIERWLLIDLNNASSPLAVPVIESSMQEKVRLRILVKCKGNRWFELDRIDGLLSGSIISYNAHSYALFSDLSSLVSLYGVYPLAKEVQLFLQPKMSHPPTSSSIQLYLSPQVEKELKLRI